MSIESRKIKCEDVLEAILRDLILIQWVDLTKAEKNILSRLNRAGFTWHVDANGTVRKGDGK